MRKYRAQRVRVDGMTCEHCELSVAKALRDAGATEIQVDHRRGEATFNLAPDIDPTVLAEAVKASGYRAGIAEVGARPGQGESTGLPGNGYDLAIIGSGGAAFAAAIRARELGARVLMVERGVLGGTCVNVGCVPSKTLLHAGNLYYQAGHHPFHGIATGVLGANLASLAEQKDELVQTLRREKYEDLVAMYGWDLVRGEASFADGKHLLVDGDTIAASHFLIATGASPAVPSIPGLAEAGFLTSTTALDLREVPESIVVIGSGYISLELGQLFRHLGSKVTLMQRSQRILRDYDPEIADSVYLALSEQSIEFATGARFSRIDRGTSGYRVRVEVDGKARVVEAEQLLVATGRQANTAALAAGAGGRGSGQPRSGRGR